jgi:hypothetical protein
LVEHRLQPAGYVVIGGSLTDGDRC